MRQDGFSLMELIIVMAIMGIVVAIATPHWNSMQQKSAVEKQVKTLYADLMTLRLDALYTKRPRAAVLTAGQFRAYSSSVTSVAPAQQKNLAYPMKWQPEEATLTLVFNASGLSTAASDTPVCVAPGGDLSAGNAGFVDSVVVSRATIKVGKREGETCEADNIAQK